MKGARSAALQGRLQLADATTLLDQACRVAVAALILLDRVDRFGTKTRTLPADEHVTWALQQFAAHPDVVALRRRLEHGVEPGV